MEREFFGSHVIGDRALARASAFFRQHGDRDGKRKCGTNRNCNYPTLTTTSSGVGGIFNPPLPGSGGDELDVKRARDSDDLLRRYTYVYFVNSMGRAAAQVIDRSPPSSRDRLLSRAIFSPTCLGGRGVSRAMIDRRLALRSLVRHAEYR